jgi:hypothetical protein
MGRGWTRIARMFFCHGEDSPVRFARGWVWTEWVADLERVSRRMGMRRIRMRRLQEFCREGMPVSGGPLPTPTA